MSDVDDGGANPPEESELIRRLRQRADQLRAGQTPAAEAPPEGPAADPAEDPVDDDADPFAGWADLSPTVDPDSRDLLSQWADEEHVETESPLRNWAPAVVAVVLVALAVVVLLGVRFAQGDDGDGSSGDARGVDADAPSVIDEDPPSLDDLTSEVTVPAGPAEGLTVADKGVTIVEDRFDPERREGTFAVIIDNPHTDWLAQGVQIDVRLLDAAGTEVGADNAFVEIVLPGQKVAVGALFFDAPTTEVVDLAVTLDVARWRESGPFDGGFTVGEVITEEAEFSGVKTTFPLRSDFAEPLTDTGVTAVYRGPDGRIVGGSDTFVDLLEPGIDTPVEITLLANIALDQITATEIYPAAGFGFVPDQ